MLLFLLPPTQSSFLQLQEAAARPPRPASSRARLQLSPKALRWLYSWARGSPGPKIRSKVLLFSLLLRVASACSNALSADPHCFPCSTPRILTSCTLQSCRSSGDTAGSLTNPSSTKRNVVVVPPCQTPRSEQSKMHLLGSGASKRIPPPAPSSTQSPSGIRNYLKKAPEIILPPCKRSSSSAAECPN